MSAKIVHAKFNTFIVGMKMDISCTKDMRQIPTTTGLTMNSNKIVFDQLNWSFESIMKKKRNSYF